VGPQNTPTDDAPSLRVRQSLTYTRTKHTSIECRTHLRGELLSKERGVGARNSEKQAYHGGIASIDSHSIDDNKILESSGGEDGLYKLAANLLFERFQRRSP